ncbi:hypothetical protein ROHU_001344 [Labeo rohita]|uniref:Uncharacterized protein n=1 Tax=Labeo rohita TaxID=84645 RepID=A0A498P1U8_LABRO|nr:hypothetical protein ROHU_001344 [Labeo rohita]
MKNQAGVPWRNNLLENNHSNSRGLLRASLRINMSRLELTPQEMFTTQDRRRLKHVRLDQNIELMNQALVSIAKENPLNITELNTLEYAAAAVIASEIRDTPNVMAIFYFYG